MKGYRRYFQSKLLWFLVTAVFAFILNFILPRLMPGDPVAAIVSRLAQNMSNATGAYLVLEKKLERLLLHVKQLHHQINLLG